MPAFGVYHAEVDLALLNETGDMEGGGPAAGPGKNVGDKEQAHAVPPARLQRAWCTARTSRTSTTLICPGSEASVSSFEVEIGGMDYGFEIQGILGMDFLRQTGAVISLKDMTVEFG